MLAQTTLISDHTEAFVKREVGCTVSMKVFFETQYDVDFLNLFSKAMNMT